MERYVEGSDQNEQSTVIVEYRFENCGEGYGAPDDFVEVTTIITRDEVLIKKRIISSRDDAIVGDIVTSKNGIIRYD